jgi:hypothetical protein
MVGVRRPDPALHGVSLGGGTGRWARSRGCGRRDPAGAAVGPAELDCLPHHHRQGSPHEGGLGRQPRGAARSQGDRRDAKESRLAPPGLQDSGGDPRRVARRGPARERIARGLAGATRAFAGRAARGVRARAVWGIAGRA